MFLNAFIIECIEIKLKEKTSLRQQYYFIIFNKTVLSDSFYYDVISCSL